MVPLDHDAWARLAHAYGSAEDIPALLEILREDRGSRPGEATETWFGLWSSLCHQGDAYTASYAAVPHLVDIAMGAGGPIDFSFYQLPAAVEIARRTGHGPPIPPDLVEPYEQAVTRLADLVGRQLHVPWDRWTLYSALTALAVAKGHIDIAEALLNLDDRIVKKIIDHEIE